jgi:hypothetical protein
MTVGRPLSKNPMVHTAVVLPRSLLEQLKRDAEVSERGLSAEIRHRLQASYNHPDDEPTDTDYVAGALNRIADAISAVGTQLKGVGQEIGWGLDPDDNRRNHIR